MVLARAEWEFRFNAPRQDNAQAWGYPKGVTESPERKPYNQEEYEAELLATSRQPFPEHLVIGTPEHKVWTETGYIGGKPPEFELPRADAGAPRGLTPEEEAEWAKRKDSEEENETDRLDREKCWHHLANPNKPLTPRHWEFCRLLAAGKPHYYIHDLLHYSRTYISFLSSHPKIRGEVKRLQDETFRVSISDRIKHANNKAFDVLEEIILTENSSDIKPQLRADVAKWIIEKSTGKAKQEVETRDGNLTDFMTLLRQFKEEQDAGQARLPEAAGQETDNTFIDITPHKVESDSLKQWVDNET